MITFEQFLKKYGRTQFTFLRHFKGDTYYIWYGECEEIVILRVQDYGNRAKFCATIKGDELCEGEFAVSIASANPFFKLE